MAFGSFIDKLFGIDTTPQQGQKEFMSSLNNYQAQADATKAYQTNVNTPGTKEAANSVMMSAKNLVDSYGASAEGFYHWLLGKPVPPSAPKMEFERIQKLAFQATGKQYTKEQIPRQLYFALGGVINRKTMFPMQGGDIGVAGEAGPEAILPLSRGSNGELGVQGGGPVNINFTINAIDAKGIDEILMERRQYITNMVRSAVAEKGRSLY
jgi:hypothetical protein